MLVFLVILSLVFLSSSSFALSQPAAATPFGRAWDLELSVAGSPLEGQPCTVEYAVTGAYCSTHIREFYQCVRTTVNDMVWQKRSEDCSKYSAICSAGECTGGYVGSSLGWAMVIFALLLIGAVTLVLTKVFRVGLRPTLAVDVILAMLFAFFILLGGV